MPGIVQPGKGTCNVVLPGLHTLGHLGLRGRLAAAYQGVEQQHGVLGHGLQLRPVIVRQPIQDGVQVVAGGHQVLAVQDGVGHQRGHPRVATGKAAVGIDAGQLRRRRLAALHGRTSAEIGAVRAFAPGCQRVVLKLAKQALPIVLVQTPVHRRGQQHDARLVQQQRAQQRGAQVVRKGPVQQVLQILDADDEQALIHLGPQGLQRCGPGLGRVVRTPGGRLPHGPRYAAAQAANFINQLVRGAYMRQLFRQEHKAGRAWAQQAGCMGLDQAQEVGLARAT